MTTCCRCSPRCGSSRRQRRRSIAACGSISPAGCLPDELREFAENRRPEKPGAGRSPAAIGGFRRVLDVQIRQTAAAASPGQQASGRRLARLAPPADRRRCTLRRTGSHAALGHGRLTHGWPGEFHRTAGGPREEAEFVSELFLGVRCSAPIAIIIRSIAGRRTTTTAWRPSSPASSAVRNVRMLARGEVSHPATGEAAVARVCPAAVPRGPGGGPRRIGGLADEGEPAVRPSHRQSTWKALMGRGLIEPVGRPAQHQPRPRTPSCSIVSRGLRATVIAFGTRCGSSPPARLARSSAAPGDSIADNRFYSRACPSRSRPRSGPTRLGDVTGLAERLRRRAGRNAGHRHRAGRCEVQSARYPWPLQSPRIVRERAAATGPVAEAAPPQRSADQCQARIAEGRLRRWIDAGKTNDEIVHEFYVRACRASRARAERTTGRSCRAATIPHEGSRWRTSPGAC